MSEYRAPLEDMRFALRDLAALENIASLPGYAEAGSDVVDAILDEAARFAGEILSPLNRVGDLHGSRLDGGRVVTAPGFREAYRRFVDGGWNGLASDPAYGGQGLPRLVAAAVSEMWKGANHAFSLCPMLTQGAIEALVLAGTESQKALYLPALVAGEWTGTMNLTEPGAGSDLAAIRCRAEPTANGAYRLYGQKIFITYGDHDLAENIVHLVLARIAGAPEGVRGISLFLVPKFLPDATGRPGARNDVQCVSLEHKLGIHGSPTAVLAFGDREGAQGSLVGEENRGLEIMFIMMNAARFNVGLEGLGDAERSYQRAAAYARERVQGTEAGRRDGAKVPILRHPDVRRMLMSMRSRIEAMRALAYVVAAAQDEAAAHPDAGTRAAAGAFAELLVPVVKGWCTENAIDIASLGIQIHGGTGYIEETGAAQHLRDARITAIYEGTTAIQANDLVGRKLVRDGGAALAALIARMRQDAKAAGGAGDDDAPGRRLETAIDGLESAGAWLLARWSDDVASALAGAVPFLMLLGTTAGGWQMARAATIASARRIAGDKSAFWMAKLATARFYSDHFLTQAPGLANAIVSGATGTLAMPEESF